MKKFQLMFISIAAIVLLAAFSPSDKNADLEKNWPAWRGPQATGVAPHANPPTNWSESENLKWKVALPGYGNSSPIIWEDRVYVTSAIPIDRKPSPTEAESAEDRGRGVSPTHVMQFTLMALARNDGRILWQKVLREALPHEGTHTDGSWAANSPVTDGEHLIAYFGSNGLYCLDLNSKLVWEKDLGDMETRRSFGEGSSPALHGNTLVVNWDHEGPSFIVALDKRTGKELWRRDRDERTSWSTPFIVADESAAQVVVSATNHVRAYDLQTGKDLWWCSGMTANAIPTPVYADGVLYAMSGFRGNALLAIRLAQARGDITSSEHIQWSYDQDTPYVPSPLLHEGRLYFTKSNNAILSCFNAKTGTPLYTRERLESLQGVYASLVGAGDRVYVTGRNGVVLVLKSSNSFEVLAENTLDDGFDASPAIAGNEIFLRGRRQLYCLADDTGNGIQSENQK